jgi:hypothetical protein
MSVPPMHPRDIARAMGDREAAGTPWGERQAASRRNQPAETTTSWGDIAFMLALWFGSSLILFYCTYLQSGQ